MKKLLLATLLLIFSCEELLESETTCSNCLSSDYQYPLEIGYRWEYEIAYSGYEVTAGEESYGNGKIINIQGIGENSKISIKFRGNMIKKFIKKYANLKIIN